MQRAVLSSILTGLAMAAASAAPARAPAALIPPGALSTLIFGRAVAPTVLVDLGSLWSYLDDGSDQGTAWRSLSFNDSGWSLGPAQLGYGDDDEATLVSFGADPYDKHITTYFRHVFNLVDLASFTSVGLQLLRDDGAIVYLNGTEIFRSGMPQGAVSASTLAASITAGAEEDELFPKTFDLGLLKSGSNVLAVEVHQGSPASTDISFDLKLSANTEPLVFLTRGPYLQLGSHSAVTVRWRTNDPTIGRTYYGLSPTDFSRLVEEAVATTEHELRIEGLDADTRYYYAVGTQERVLAGGGAAHYFKTAPPTGSFHDTRIWVIGDSGKLGSNAKAVRDAYLAFTGQRGTDLWLMLGDNAYTDGTDAQYQARMFDVYPSLLRNTVLWSTLGNHDGATADSATQTGPYYDIFNLPRQAEAGGVISNTEAYYSFDYGNIHFVCLDSFDSDRDPDGPMLTWLADDLAATSADWIIAFWHHPPYSKGSHDSDVDRYLIDMRENALPILERHGVDLVLTGHSHSYERSVLIDQHYGASHTLRPWMLVDSGDGREDGDGSYLKPSAGLAPNEGAVYIVAGSASQTSGGDLDHPVMEVSLDELGSLVLDIKGSTLTAHFVNDQRVVRDYFTLVKGNAEGVVMGQTH